LSSQSLLDRAELLVEEGELELIKTGVQSVAVAELAGALTDLGPGDGAAAGTDKTRLREVNHTCSYMYRRYMLNCKSQVSGSGPTCQNQPCFPGVAVHELRHDPEGHRHHHVQLAHLGALIVDERPHVKEWDDPQFGISNIGIEES
jgi:hypothetical protein